MVWKQAWKQSRAHSWSAASLLQGKHLKPGCPKGEKETGYIFLFLRWDKNRKEKCFKLNWVFSLIFNVGGSKRFSIKLGGHLLNSKSCFIMKRWTFLCRKCRKETFWFFIVLLLLLLLMHTYILLSLWLPLLFKWNSKMFLSVSLHIIIMIMHIIIMIIIYPIVIINDNYKYNIIINIISNAYYNQCICINT